MMLGKIFSKQEVVVFFAMLLHCIGFGQIPGCTKLSIPSDGATEVAVDTDFEWSAAMGATGYQIRIGTTSGGNDVLDLEDLGNVTLLNLESNLPPLSDIYVSIFPFNDNGINMTCSEFRFTTGMTNVPDCADLTFPEHAVNNVPLIADLRWLPVEGATGYLLTIRTSNGASEVLSMFDVGNVTEYTTPQLMPNTTYFVAIVPFNDLGNAQECGVQSSFTTTGLLDPIQTDCPDLLIPLSGSKDVSVLTDLVWTEDTDADGYILTIGTTLDGSDIIDGLDVGNTTTYQLLSDLPGRSIIYVSITPYTGESSSKECTVSSFTTSGSTSIETKEFIPKFFTPNSDGVNDEWKVEPPENISIQQILVFDRYGLLLKQMESFQSWDGTFNGRRLPSGSYWYTVQLIDAPQIRGFFALKR